MAKNSMRPPEDEGYVYKSQEFERDLDRDAPDDRVDRLEFGDNANDVFLYDDAMISQRLSKGAKTYGRCWILFYLTRLTA